LFNGGKSEIVTGKAVAAWGIAGGGAVAPFALDIGACPLFLVVPPPVNSTCDVLYDNNDTQARWGGMILSTWGTVTPNVSKCPSATTNTYDASLASPPVELLATPTYVCSDNGFSNIFDHVAPAILNKLLFFPVVEKNGTSIYWGKNPDQMFKVIGLVGMVVVSVKDVKKNDVCGVSVASNASAGCLTLKYVGPVTGGIGSGTCFSPTNPSVCVKSIKLVG